MRNFLRDVIKVGMIILIGDIHGEFRCLPGLLEHVSAGDFVCQVGTITTRAQVVGGLGGRCGRGMGHLEKGVLMESLAKVARRPGAMREWTDEERAGMLERAYLRYGDHRLAQRCVQWIEDGRRMANETAKTNPLTGG